MPKFLHNPQINKAIEKDPLETITANEIRAKRPDLFYEMRKDWLRSFHIEDLEEPPETTWVEQLIPIMPWIIVIIETLVIVFKK